MAGGDHSEIEWVDGAPVFTVGQFAGVMKGVLDQSFPDGVWIEGEIQGLRPPKPHMYFSLVENDRGRSAQVNITVFANVVREIRGKLALVGAELKDGMRIRMFGAVDFYAPTGRLGLKVSDVDMVSPSRSHEARCLASRPTRRAAGSRPMRASAGETPVVQRSIRAERSSASRHKRVEVAPRWSTVASSIRTTTDSLIRRTHAFQSADSSTDCDRPTT